MNAGAAFLRLVRMLPLRAVLPAGMASLAASASGMLLMGASAWLIVSAAYHPPLYTLAIGITLVRACGLGRAVFRYLERWLSHRAVFSMLTGLRLSLYRMAAGKLPLREGTLREGELLHDLGMGSDILKDFYLRALAPPLYSLLLTLPVLFLLWPLLGGTSLVLLFSWLLCLLPSFWAAKCSEGMEFAAESTYRDSLLEWQGGWRELVTAGQTEIARQWMDKESQRLKELQRKEQRREHLCDALAKLAQGGTLLWFLMELVPCVSEGRMTAIDLAVWLLLLLSLLESYLALPAAARAGSRTLSIAKRVWKEERGEQVISEQGRSPASSPQAGEATCMGNERFCLQAEAVSFSYLSSVPVLKHLDLSLSEGEHATLLGESGTGKTTLLYLLLGFWKPDEGRILLHGKDVREYGREALAASVLAATAGNHIFNLSIRENFCLLHPDISDEKIWECLAICQLKELVESLPDQLDAELGEEARKLSGGEKKRLQLALALTGETSLLLLDEPTANLDRKMAQNVMDAVLRHREGRTLLVITHDLPLAERMEHVWRLTGEH